MICQKIKYPTIEEAEKALVALRKIPRRHESSIYLCPHCDVFHLTSQKTTKTQVVATNPRSDGSAISIEEVYRDHLVGFHINTITINKINEIHTTRLYLSLDEAFQIGEIFNRYKETK